VNQRGYQILIETFALKIFDEKRNQKYSKKKLEFYITDPEAAFHALSEKPIQDFIKRTKGIRAEAEGHIYHVLVASITYFKGQDGDEIVLLVPEGAPTKWAAVENIIKAGHSSEIAPIIAEEKKETV